MKITVSRQLFEKETKALKPLAKCGPGIDQAKLGTALGSFLLVGFNKAMTVLDCRCNTLDLELTFGIPFRGMEGDTSTHCGLVYVLNTLDLFNTFKLLGKSDTLVLEFTDGEQVKLSVPEDPSETFIVPHRSDLETLDPLDVQAYRPMASAVLDTTTVMDFVTRCDYARSKEDYRAELTATLLEFTEDMLTMVNCDGHRLAARFIDDGEVAADADTSAMLQESAVRLLKDRAKLHQGGTIKIEILSRKGDKPDMITIDMKDTEQDALGVLIKAKPYDSIHYPRWQNVVPDIGSMPISVTFADMKKAADGAAKLAKVARKDECVDFALTQESVQLTAPAGKAQAVKSLDAGVSMGDAPSDGNFAMGFNVSYLADTLRSMKDVEEVQMHIANKVKAVVFIPTTEEANDIRLLMPVRRHKNDG